MNINNCIIKSVEIKTEFKLKVKLILMPLRHLALL